MNKDALMLAWANLRHAKKRTYLTIIGIFIGIAAVVALVSLGQGLQASINDQFEEIGTDKLFISHIQDAFGGTAGEDITDPLTEDDMEVIRGVFGVKEVSSWTIRSARIEVGEDVGFYFVGAMPTEQEAYELLRDLLTVDLVDGRELRPGDKGAVLVGNDYSRREVFLEPIGVGDRIIVNDVKYTVAGILEPLGNSADDRTIWVPKDAFDDQFDTGKTVSTIIVQVNEGEDPIEVATRVEDALLSERGLDEEEKDFNIQTPEDILASFNTVLIVVQVVLTGIAAISLLVGGVGITNTMYTAVVERTKEIGIMKAIGASPKMILSIFLAEAGILGLIGGGIGAAIGLAIAKGVEFIGRVAMRTDFVTAYVSVWLVVGVLLFAMIVGMISGFLPARQAAKQDAVESLRYE